MLEKISLAGSIMFRDGSVDVLCMEQLCLDHFIDDVSIFFDAISSLPDLDGLFYSWNL